MRVRLRHLSLVLALLAPATPALAASTAFRIVDLDLRDPHVYYSFVGCYDVTNNTQFGSSYNSSLQASLQTDSDGDGRLDLSYLVIFDPLDPSGPGEPMRFGTSDCTAPLAGTTCGPGPNELLQSLTATNVASGTCLAPIAGTTHAYSPSIAPASSPGFVSSELPLFWLAAPPLGVVLPLRSFRLAATWSGGPPATGLVNGLMMGFLTESDADNTILPATVPIVGGQPLSVLLPGGDPPGTAICCAAFSDKDTGPASESGWWMYFNFVAQAVPYTGPSVGVDSDPSFGLTLASPNPGRGPVALACELDADGPASVTVHDLGGRRVAVLMDGWQAAGHRSLTWDRRLESGGLAAPGLYVVRLSSARSTLARKVLLLR